MPRILLIEDNQANLELMCYLLGAFGYNATTAADGLAGLETARSISPDLIICDVHMPVVDGYEVARQLKADPCLRGVPLVAVTALAMVGDRERILASGFDGYIAKPIDPQTFVQQVEGHIPPELHKSIARPAVDVAASTRPAPLREYSVLVVDNQPVNLDLARSLLEPHGYRVFTADGAESGLQAARENGCDLILSDVCMTGSTGYELIEAVKADPNLRDIPFIFLTSTMADEQERAKGLALGARRFLFRPIDPRVLLSEIEACVVRNAVHGNHPDR